MIGAKTVRNRYLGNRASNYEARRAHRPFWKAENKAVEAMLADMPPKSKILDVPCGTARYAPIYQRHGFIVQGIDASPDMLTVAEHNISALNFDGFKVKHGDIFALDGSFDAVVCTRFLNWLLPDEMVESLVQLRKVCRGRLILSIEIGKHKDKECSPHLQADFERALRAIGGSIKREIPIERNYKICLVE